MPSDDMTPGLLTFAATLGGFIAVILGLKLVLEPSRVLRLGIFRPYRGHPWPQGVQEEEVRFSWSRRHVPRAPIEPSWSDIVVHPMNDGSAPPTDPPATIEDVTGEPAAVRAVERVSVREGRH
jgi:hypothetical protein